MPQGATRSRRRFQRRSGGDGRAPRSGAPHRAGGRQCKPGDVETGRIFTPSGPTSATAIVRLRPTPPPPPPPPPSPFHRRFRTGAAAEAAGANVSMSGITVRSPTTVAEPTGSLAAAGALERARHLLGAGDETPSVVHGRPLSSVPALPLRPPRDARVVPSGTDIAESPPEPRIRDVDPQDRQRRRRTRPPRRSACHDAASRTRTPRTPSARPPRLRRRLP